MDIDLNIRLAHVSNVQTPMDVVVFWVRGTKEIDTKVKQLSAANPEAMFNEKFKMNTQLDYDSLRRQFARKKSDL